MHKMQCQQKPRQMAAAHSEHSADDGARSGPLSPDEIVVAVQFTAVDARIRVSRQEQTAEISSVRHVRFIVNNEEGVDTSISGVPEEKCLTSECGQVVDVLRFLDPDVSANVAFDRSPRVVQRDFKIKNVLQVGGLPQIFLAAIKGVDNPIQVSAVDLAIDLLKDIKAKVGEMLADADAAAPVTYVFLYPTFMEGNACAVFEKLLIQVFGNPRTRVRFAREAPSVVLLGCLPPPSPPSPSAHPQNHVVISTEYDGTKVSLVRFEPDADSGWKAVTLSRCEMGEAGVGAHAMALKEALDRHDLEAIHVAMSTNTSSQNPSAPDFAPYYVNEAESLRRWFASKELGEDEDEGPQAKKRQKKDAIAFATARSKFRKFFYKLFQLAGVRFAQPFDRAELIELAKTCNARAEEDVRRSLSATDSGLFADYPDIKPAVQSVVLIGDHERTPGLRKAVVNATKSELPAASFLCMDRFAACEAALNLLKKFPASTCSITCSSTCAHDTVVTKGVALADSSVGIVYMDGPREGEAEPMERIKRVISAKERLPISRVGWEDWVLAAVGAEPLVNTEARWKIPIKMVKGYFEDGEALTEEAINGGRIAVKTFEIICEADEKELVEGREFFFDVTMVSRDTITLRASLKDVVTLQGTFSV